MKVHLRYGRAGLEVDVPNSTTTIDVLHMHEVPVVPQPQKVVEEQIEQPLGSPPLSELARGRDSACLVVSDITRPVPNKLLLPPVLRCLEANGIKRKNISILIATGLHRPNLGAELEEIIGADVAAHYNVVNHHARVDEEQNLIGEASNGAPAFIDKTYLQADLKILTGLIEPHLMAGYSGGRKLVCPGIAGWRTIKVFHSPALLEDARATNGVLDGNPVHNMSREIATMAGVDFILNVTLDEPRRITGVFAGEMEAAHLAGVEEVNKMVKVFIGEPADIVVTTSAGYPLDTTFYQAIKGLVGALPAVKRGGTMIMAASLSEGLGSPEFAQLCLEMGSVESFTQKLFDPNFFVFDQWQAEELVKVLRHCEVMIYSDGIDRDTLRKCLVTPIDSVEDGIRRALDKHGKNARIIVIPEGPYVLPSCITL